MRKFQWKASECPVSFFDNTLSASITVFGHNEALNLFASSHWHLKCYTWLGIIPRQFANLRLTLLTLSNCISAEGVNQMLCMSCFHVDVYWEKNIASSIWRHNCLSCPADRLCQNHHLLGVSLRLLDAACLGKTKTREITSLLEATRVQLSQLCLNEFTQHFEFRKRFRKRGKFNFGQF